MTQISYTAKQQTRFHLNRQWLLIIAGLLLQITVMALAFVGLLQAGQPDMTLAPVAGKPGFARITSVATFTDEWVNGIQPGALVHILGPDLPAIRSLNPTLPQETSHSIFVNVIDRNIIVHLNMAPQSIDPGNLFAGCLLAFIFSLTGITIYLRASDRPVARIAYFLFYFASIIFFLVNVNNTLWTRLLLYILGLVTWGMATTFVCLLPRPTHNKNVKSRIQISAYTPLTIGVILTAINLPVILFLPWARTAVSVLTTTYTICCMPVILWVMFWGLKRLSKGEKQIVRLIVIGIVFLLFVLRFNHNVVVYSSFVLNSFTYVSTIYIIPLMILPIVCGYALIRHQFLGTTSLISRQVMRVLLWIFLASLFIVTVLTIMYVTEDNLSNLGDKRYFLYAILIGLSLWLFPLIWNKVRNIGDQVFYHDFYEYNRSLSDLSAELTRLRHLDQICMLMLPRLATLLHSTGAALIVRTQGHSKGTISEGGDLAAHPWRIYLNASFIPLDRLTSIANLALTHQRQRSGAPLLLDNILLLPLYDGNYLSGFLCMGSKLNYEPYSRQDKSFLATLAAQLSVLEVNSRYLEQAEADAQKLTALNRRVISVQEDERRHFALELHDEVLQQAMLLVRQLADAGTMTDIAETMPLARSLVISLRQTCLELRPPLLDELGLEEALSWLAKQTEQRANRGEPGSQGSRGTLTVNVSCIETSNVRLSADVELAFYRVVQEALSNILKHARANRVTIRLRYNSRAGMSLLICDNGHGFTKGQTTSEQLGLVGMHERMGAVEGHLQLRTSIGRGVAIRALYQPTPISTQEKEIIEAMQ
jgi:signal transduction histidine kinase